MSNEFYTILTDAGLTAIANASISSSTVNFAKVMVGDGNGAYYTPTKDMIALRNKTWEGPVASVEIDPTNPNWVTVEAVIPATDGGFYIREIGISDEAGTLLAIGKLPETYKPALDSGSTKDLYLRAIFEVSNASVITLRTDPSVVLASKKYVDDKVVIVSNNLTRVQQDLANHLEQSGQVTSIKLSANQTIAAGSYLEVAFGNLSSLKNADYIELVNGQIKFKQSGVYKIYGIVASIETASSNGIRYVLVDGVLPSSSPTTVGIGVFTSVVINTTRAKNVNDTLSIAFYHNNSTAIDISANNTIIYIERLGDLD